MSTGYNNRELSYMNDLKSLGYSLDMMLHVDAAIIRFGKRYNVSPRVVKKDIIKLRRIHPSCCITPAAQLKSFVLSRDNNTCQYCGKSSGKMIIEHVIPVILGGCGKEYNLVCSCQSCNSNKRHFVWMPDNIQTLISINPDWAALIIEKAAFSLKRKK